MAIPHSFYFMVCVVTCQPVVSCDSGLSGMSDSQLTVTNQFEIDTKEFFLLIK